MLAFYHWITSMTVKSKDSISTTEALRKKSTFSLKKFHYSNTEPWLLIEIGIAEAEYDDFLPFFVFYFFRGALEIVTLLTVTLSPYF